MFLVIVAVAVLGIINSGCTPQSDPAPVSITSVAQPAPIETETPVVAPSAAPQVNAPQVAVSPAPVVVAPSPTPAVTPAPSSSPSPTYSVTTDIFIFFNAAGICAALDNWDSRVTTIIFPVNSSANGLIYTFEDAGVFIGARDGTGKALVGYGGGTVSIPVTGGTAHALCTATVTNGHYEGVQ